MDGGPITRRLLRERYSPQGGLDRRFAVLSGHDVLFVKVPKAGSSTIVNWLARVERGIGEGPLRTKHTEHGLRPSDVGWPRTMALLNGAGYRFTFVRDPHRRLESAYLDKIATTRDERWRDLVRGTLGTTEGVPTFEEFVTAVEAQDPVREMDPHWRPQHLVLMHPVCTYDRIGRLERLEEDLRLVCEESGLPWAPVVARNAGKARRPSSVYDGRPDLVERVARIYAEDIALYGY